MTPGDAYGALDEALTSVAWAGPDLTNGLSNHAPMAMEALCALGRGGLVLPWLARYRPGLAPRPARVEPITEAGWQGALGDVRRSGDWFELFRAALEERPWPEVLQRWVGRLAPGIIASAFHGVIRTGHAVRAIALEDTPARRRELADGLAVWAADYQTLPGERRTAGGTTPAGAIGRVPMIPPEERPLVDTLTGALGQLQSFTPFHAVLGAVQPTGDPSAFLSELTAVFAGVYLRNARDFLSAIAFVHTVTGPSALRPMLPYLGVETAETALVYAWQASAALYASFGRERFAGGEVETRSTDAGELVERATACGDEHGIKFTEVCLREHALAPRPVFLAAAAHAVGILGRTG